VTRAWAGSGKVGSDTHRIQEPTEAEKERALSEKPDLSTTLPGSGSSDARLGKDRDVLLVTGVLRRVATDTRSVGVSDSGLGGKRQSLRTDRSRKGARPVREARLVDDAARFGIERCPPRKLVTGVLRRVATDTRSVGVSDSGLGGKRQSRE
jgi:hypothetical protein